LQEAVRLVQPYNYKKKPILNNFIVNVGGDLCVLGKPEERPWDIGICDSRDRAVVACWQVSS
jgi:thiamine biosynthesis lipoprotein ApbE